MRANQSRPRCALVITLDRFPASILGCYGNEWIETPHVDRLAAHGSIADNCWTPRIGPATADDVFAVLGALTALTSHSVRTLLFQEAEVQTDFSAIPFDRREVIRGDLGPTAKPDRIPLANLARRAVHAMSVEHGSQHSYLVWMHASGLTLPAFPPAGFADLYQDEFEDREVTFENMSEEERWHHPITTAGMASLLDHWIGHVVAALTGDTLANPALIIITAAQGAGWQPLPSSFGSLDELRSQAVLVPWVMQTVRNDEPGFSAGRRTDRLSSTRNLGPLLESWFRRAEFRTTITDQVSTFSQSGAMRITTSDWAVIFPASPIETSEANSADTSQRQTLSAVAEPLLFHKPEDFWEVNNLAAVYPDVLVTLTPPKPAVGDSGTAAVKRLEPGCSMPAE